MGRYLAREIPRLLIRLGLAFTVYGLIGAVRWPEQVSAWVATLSFGGLAAAIIVLSGKLLYDTLFYERFWRSVDSR